MLLSAAISCWMTGCMPETDIAGVVVPNALPQTEITGTPPNLVESGFAIDFFWTGYDPDGLVDGFQWKISNNGLDGINVADTLTFDPVTGDTINPWRFTTATDTTFLVTADIGGFPGDPEARARSYQVHTLFIRALDDEGGVDATPAHISFTATTVLPRVRVDLPASLQGQTEAGGTPPSVTFGFEGEDPDFDLGTPTHVRFLWKEAWTSTEGYIGDRPVFEANMDSLGDFADSLWGPWIKYEADAGDRRVNFPDQPTEVEKRWLFAIQARDTAGAVSIDRSYGVNVMNVKIVQNLAPRLEVYEPFLGTKVVFFTNTVFHYDIAAGQQLRFSWNADADLYAGEIVSYRYGWDVADPNDDDDPGWGPEPGLGPDNLRTEIVSFESGLHTLTVQCVDNSGLVTRYKAVLDVVPIPPLDQQLPLLLVDDVYDHESNRWPRENTGEPLDRDQYRDAFWRTALGPVVGWYDNQHVIDTEDSRIEYRDVVNFRSLVWTSKYTTSGLSHISEAFRPTGPTVIQPGGCEVDQLNWLVTYQRRAGNLLLASSRAMDNFIGESPSYMTPIIFDTRDETMLLNDQLYIIGFGECDLPDGSQQRMGLTRYPYQVIGVSMIDAVSPRYHIYNSPLIGFMARKSQCVGAKGLMLDEDFRSSYLPDGGIDDLIMTNTTIDWADNYPENYQNLDNPWSYKDTEFYDVNIANRPASVSPQLCDDGNNAQILCLDPMFKIYARFDWIRYQYIAAGDSLWPQDSYGDDELAALCGNLALQSDHRSSRTQGRTCGFVTNKNKFLKPSNRGDVIWGFDPYRYDEDQITEAIHWVLGEHFGLIID